MWLTGLCPGLMTWLSGGNGLRAMLAVEEAPVDADTEEREADSIRRCQERAPLMGKHVR